MLVVLLVVLSGPLQVWGAVGCDLNDPDRDVARLFPESTGYKTIYTSILKKGGEKLLATVERRLGDKFHGIYETIDVPYTIYEIFTGKKKVGYIHGVNQKGQFGGIQVFLALDLEGRIKAFYIQKMTSQYAGKLRDAKFGRQFIGLTLKDFEQYDVVTGKAAGKVEAIRNPAPEAEADFRAALRATKKNLILMDEFIFQAVEKHPSASLPSSFTVQRTSQYASRQSPSGALHPGVFEQPGMPIFLNSSSSIFQIEPQTNVLVQAASLNQQEIQQPIPGGIPC